MAGNRLLRSTVRKMLRVALHYWYPTEERLLFTDAAANVPPKNDVLYSVLQVSIVKVTDPHSSCDPVRRATKL